VADSRVDPAELERLGLYDPDDEYAAERLELIEYLLVGARKLKGFDEPVELFRLDRGS
jgi:hypothetical protein